MKNALTCLTLISSLLVVTVCHAQNSVGASLVQKGQKLEAAGDKAGAAVAYQQAYEAYMSVDNSDGMIKAVALKKAVEGGSTAVVISRPTSARPAAPVAVVVKNTVPPPVSPPPMAGQMLGGKPVGLFFFMSVFNEQRIYYFTSAGQVYVDPDNFSAAGLAAVAPNWRGTFAINGKQMTIKWANGQTKTASNYHFDPTGFGWEGSFICLSPFASPKQLVGTFEGRNAAVSVDANSNVLFRTLNFKSDGTFTRDNYAAAHVETNTGFASDASSAAKQAGHWQLNGWYLTLSDGKGTRRGIAFPTSTVDGTNTGKALYFRFNGTTYSNTDRR